ncbi:MAG: hypothetical protein QM235_14630, partial [Pseudomonadota bacterium]|nr:hypothetical protein [Pseudomonadota bacterium]
NFDNTNTFNAAGRRNVIRNNQAYIGNLIWDVNPAVRFGLEYSRVVTGWGHFAASDGATAAGVVGAGGKSDNVRFAAWYFF